MEHSIDEAATTGAAGELSGLLRTAREHAGAARRPAPAATGAVFLQLLPHIATSMPRNEVACVLRLLCKAAAATLRGPEHATVHLSEPVPHAEFRWRWCGSQSLRSTTHEHRQKLEELTARSGVVANLEALIEARGDLERLSPTWEWEALLAAAAGAGRLELCRWLHEQRGVPLTARMLMVAAGAGDTQLCEWMLGCCWDFGAACAALRQGHVRLAEWLLEVRPQPARPLSHGEACELVFAAACGCNLAILQRLHAEHVASRGLDLAEADGFGCIAEAAGSPTSDWAAKVEWLEGLGFRRNASVCAEAARCKKDGAARLAWLVQRGYPLEPYTAYWAALAGNTQALRYVLAQGVALPDDHTSLFRELEQSPNTLKEVFQTLHEAGAWVTLEWVQLAAHSGSLPLVEWAVAKQGDGAALTADVFRAAAQSGSLPLLRWLHERGCPWDASVSAAAGTEEALEWLLEHGCPMEEDGEAYVPQHGSTSPPCTA